MSRKQNPESRCPTCHMHRSLCICALVPRIETRSKLLLLVHHREEQKPTNTGQLAARCLVGSRIAIVGDLARPLPQPLVAPGEHAVVLFPSSDAVPIASIAAPMTVIVPDGSWGQAKRMPRRVPGLDSLPRVTFDDPTASEYRLRTEPRPDGVSTLEAIARAWRVLEGEAAADALLAVFRVMVSRTLWLRGAIKDHEVTGGLPIGATRQPVGD